MQNLLEYLVKKLQKTHIFEMAYSRNKYMDVLDGLKKQLLENWCLIRFCTLSNRIQTKEHWQNELYSHIDNLIDMHLKIKNKKDASEEVLIDWAEYNNFDNVYKAIWKKLKDENIDKSDKNILKSCEDFSKYGVYEIIDIISMKPTSENIEYIDEYIYNKI